MSISLIKPSDAEREIAIQTNALQLETKHSNITIAVGAVLTVSSLVAAVAIPFLGLPAMAVIFGVMGGGLIMVGGSGTFCVGLLSRIHDSERKVAYDQKIPEFWAALRARHEVQA